MGIDTLRWPNADYSRVPYSVFLDPDLHAIEQERIFRGPVWLYLGLDAEVPNPGDYITTVAGDTPVVVVRALDGSVHAFVNRCAHRGTLLVRNQFGNAKDFTCVYHHWCYDHTGNLIGVPFLRGLKGKGGMPKDFNLADHGLERLKVEVFASVIFGSFHAAPESLGTFIDRPMCEWLERFFAKPIEILGYTRQRIPGNWKLYVENTHDGYHAGLLHQMSTTFGLFRATEDGGIKLDKGNRHEVTFSIHASDKIEESKEAYRDTAWFEAPHELKDPSVFDFIDEYGNNMAANFCTLFPNVIFQQLANSLATRQIRPRKWNEFDLYWTYFGYQDDSAKLRATRMKNANIVGAAGYSSMEDGEVGRLCQIGIKGGANDHSVIEMGGLGPIGTQYTTVTEVPIRGMWLNYCKLMGIPVANAAAA
ncbi:MAG: Rieske 2Fe-2S domain-containing protein [Alphaproteobacteria bacterium]|nr:Rieske 2Fe-2S domain-containing protein [Alphaproteobacteria bacterium]